MHQGLVGFDEGCQRVKAFCSSEVEMFFECIEPEAHQGHGGRNSIQQKDICLVLLGIGTVRYMIIFAHFLFNMLKVFL